MTRALTPEQVTALRQLRAHLPEARILLVGASALGLHLDMTWRATADLDVCVAIGIEDLTRLSSIAGWVRHPALEHRWTTPEGVVVDIVPANDEALRAGEVRWPRGGQVMSLLGFRAAYRSAVDADVGGVVVGLPPAAAIVLLKMVAYLDRPADRGKDLKDIAYTIDRHLADDDPARFDDPAIRDLELDHGESGAFLLGRALAGIVDADENAAVMAFLATVEDERDRHATGVKLARGAPPSWGAELDDKEASLQRLIRALKRGFQLPRETMASAATSAADAVQSVTSMQDEVTAVEKIDKLSWQQIESDDPHTAAFRCKVPGGWLIMMRPGIAATPALVFIPEPAHSWEIRPKTSAP